MQHLQIRHDSPDGAIALTRRQRDRNLLFDSFEDFDVARHRGFFNEHHVVRFDRGGELNQRRRWYGRMSVEHHGSVRPHVFPRAGNRLHHAVNVDRCAGVLVDTVRRHLLSFRRVIDANAVACRTTQKSVHRHVPQLAGKVPQRDVDRGDRMHHQGTAAHIAMRSIQLLPDVLDTCGVLAIDQLKQRLHQNSCDSRIDPLEVTPAADPVIGLDFHIHNWTNPIRLHARDANTRRTIENLCRRILFVPHNLVRERQARGSSPETGQQIAASQRPG